MKQTHRAFYSMMWRWHFYAGLIFAPFILILTITGSIYLFKPQIEHSMYRGYYEVEAQHHKLLPSQQIAAVTSHYPEAQVTRYRPGEGTTRSAEVKIKLQDQSLTIFVDPYSGKIIGELNDKDRLMDRMEEFHGELMLGTVGDRLVELAACWTIILIVTGAYLWYPKKKRRLLPTLIPRWRSGKHHLIRDLHAIPAFWISAAMLFLVITGLLWSGLWGTKVQYLATNTGVGYPPSVWVGSAPTSAKVIKEVADVPWAAQNLEVPSSSNFNYLPVSIDDVVLLATDQEIYPTYSVIFPKSKEGVYTISAFPPKAKDEATLHIDQYTGAVLADYRYEHYQPLGKWMAWGITVHKGLEYGLANQIAGLIVCLGIMGVVGSGVILWWVRKPQGQLGAPKSPGIKKIRGLAVFLLIFSVLFPLVGASLILVYLLDWLLIQRIESMRKFFHA